MHDIKGRHIQRKRSKVDIERYLAIGVTYKIFKILIRE